MCSRRQSLLVDLLAPAAAVALDAARPPGRGQRTPVGAARDALMGPEWPESLADYM